MSMYCCYNQKGVILYKQLKLVNPLLSGEKISSSGTKMSDLVVLDFRASAFDFVADECAEKYVKARQLSCEMWSGIPLLNI